MTSLVKIKRLRVGHYKAICDFRFWSSPYGNTQTKTDKNLLFKSAQKPTEKKTFFQRNSCAEWMGIWSCLCSLLLLQHVRRYYIRNNNKQISVCKHYKASCCCCVCGVIFVNIRTILTFFAFWHRLCIACLLKLGFSLSLVGYFFMPMIKIEV